MNTLYVVTNTELGWDCVVGVFSGLTREQLDEKFDKYPYVISEMAVETNLESWD